MKQLLLSSITAWDSSVNNLFVQRCTIFHGYSAVNNSFVQRCTIFHWDKQTELLHHFPMFEHSTEGCRLPNASCSLTNSSPTSAQHNNSSSTTFNGCNADKEKESYTTCWRWCLHIVSLLIRPFSRHCCSYSLSQRWSQNWPSQFWWTFEEDLRIYSNEEHTLFL